MRNQTNWRNFSQVKSTTLSLTNRLYYITDLTDDSREEEIPTFCTAHWCPARPDTTIDYFPQCWCNKQISNTLQVKYCRPRSIWRYCMQMKRMIQRKTSDKTMPMFNADKLIEFANFVGKLRRFLKIACTIPVTSVQSARSFSCLKLVNKKPTNWWGRQNAAPLKFDQNHQRRHFRMFSLVR